MGLAPLANRIMGPDVQVTGACINETEITELLCSNQERIAVYTVPFISVFQHSNFKTSRTVLFPAS